MRRSTRLGIVAVALLLVLLGAYAAYWRIAAGRIARGLAVWQQSAQTRDIEAAWKRLRIGGFPLTFRITLDGARLRDGRLTPAPELRAPLLVGSARPWNFADWRLAAPAGLSAGLAASGDRPSLSLAAQSAEGAASFGRTGAGWLWVRLHGAEAQAGADIAIKTADAWITLPVKSPRAHTDAGLGVALDLHQVHLPAPPENWSATIAELALGATLKGALPDGPLLPAIATWRDAGGTIEVDHLQLDWGGLGVNATGTLALDQNLQPIAAFSGGIEGFATILSALVHADRLDEEQATLLRIALGALAKPGPDGNPQIRTAFTVQNGKMYLGPAELGAAPRIVWK